MLKIQLLLFLGSILITSCHEEDIHTIKYTNENFSDNVRQKNHFVMFYAPWCGHCQKFAPKWEQLAEMLNDDDSNNIKIAKVDCTTDSEVCSEQDITGYPTLKFYKVGDDNGVRFKGSRDLPTITTFINNQLREGEEIVEEPSTEAKAVGGLVELSDNNFENYVESGKHFIKFYAPWCGHCQKLASTWEDLAKTFESNNDISIAKVDCTQFRAICNKFDVKGYPTLLWIENGRKIDKYQGDRSHNDLKQYVEKMVGTILNIPVEESIDAKNIEPSELTSKNFNVGIESGVTFIKFFAPWCGHCKRLLPTWEQLREKFIDNERVHIYKVDCTLDENKQLCNDQEVEGFPTIFLYKEGNKVSEYSGSRSLEDLYDFVNKNLGHDEL